MTTMDFRYVFGYFEENDVIDRLQGDCAYEDALDYIRDNDLMDEVIMWAVDWLRDYMDFSFGDTYWDALDYAVEKATGKKLSGWEEE